MTTLNKRWPEPITQNVVVADAMAPSSTSGATVAPELREPTRGATGASFWVMLCLTIATGAAGLALGEVPKAKAQTVAAAAQAPAGTTVAVAPQALVVNVPTVVVEAASTSASAPEAQVPAEKDWVGAAAEFAAHEAMAKTKEPAKSAAAHRGKGASKPAPHTAPKSTPKKPVTVTASPDTTTHTALLDP